MSLQTSAELLIFTCLPGWNGQSDAPRPAFCREFPTCAATRNTTIPSFTEENSISLNLNLPPFGSVNGNVVLTTSASLEQPSGTWTQSYFYDGYGRLTNVKSSAGDFGCLPFWNAASRSCITSPTWPANTRPILSRGRICASTSPPRRVPHTDALPHWSRLVSHSGVTRGGQSHTDWLCRHE